MVRTFTLIGENPFVERAGITLMSHPFSKIYIEKEAKSTPLARNLLSRLGHDKITWLSARKDKLGARDRDFIIQDIMRERDPYKIGKKTLILTTHSPAPLSLFTNDSPGHFFNKCPGTKGLLCCNYFVINPVIGCNYDCEYCFLQGYLDSPVVMVHTSLEKDLAFLGRWLEKRKNKFFRIGTGELSDSLSLDPLLSLSPLLVNFFQKYPNVQFELKTKSHHIENLPRLKKISNVVVSFSVNPEMIIQRVEHGTSSLKKRLQAAQEAVQKGYRLALHFDPIILFPGWQGAYEKLIRNIFTTVEPNAIQFISLGAMRYFKELKAEMKRRFPGTMLLEGPFTRGPDGKSRYFRPVREEIFETISAMILEQDPKQWLYFCMEGKNTWKNVFNLKVDHRKNLDKFFKMRRQGNSERLIALPGQDKT